MLTIAPNKQTILLLKKQQKLVQNGHKLLKEKLVGLIRIFTDLVQQGFLLEKKLNQELEVILKQYQKSTLFVNKKQLLALLEEQKQTLFQIEIKEKKILGVTLQEVRVQVRPSTEGKLKKNLDLCLEAFVYLFPTILQVNQLKANCRKLSQEIKKTLRQISNLEKRQQIIAEQIKYIKSVLEEQSNLNRATLIRIFKK